MSTGDDGLESRLILWYRVLVNDNPIGYMFTLRVTNTTGIRYVEEMNFGVSRGTDKVTMFARTTSTEDYAGATSQMGVTQKTAETKISSLAFFNGTGFNVVNFGNAGVGGAGDTAQYVEIGGSNGNPNTGDNSDSHGAADATFVGRVAAQRQFEEACRDTSQRRHVVRTVRPELGLSLIHI